MLEQSSEFEFRVHVFLLNFHYHLTNNVLSNSGVRGEHVRGGDCIFCPRTRLFSSGTEK